GVIRPGMICYLILNYLDAEPVRRINQLSQLRERAEVLFDFIEVHRAVAVIIRDRPPRCAGSVRILLALIQVIDIVIPGREPDRSDAKIFEIREVINDSLKITSMIVTTL